MGLFSSSYRTSVNTSVSRAIDDTSLPDSIKIGTVKAIFAEGEIADYLLEELVGSVGMKAERMYRFAEKHYTHGMPSGEIYSATQGREEVEALLGPTASLEYSRVGPPNAMHIGCMKFKELYNHNETTNQIPVLTAQKGTPVYLKDAVLVVPAGLIGSLSPRTLDHWGSPASSGYSPDRKAQTGNINTLVGHSPIDVSEAATDMFLLVTYIWEEVGTYQVKGTNTFTVGLMPKEDFLYVPITGYVEDADYFHVKYSQAGDTHYVMYQVGTGTFPTLDAVFNKPLEVMGEFFPFAYFRHNKTPMNADKNSEAYKTTKKMLKYLGMDYDTVTEAVHENPGINDVEQAMLIMAVPANTTNALEQRYLYDFFNELYFASPGQFKTQTAQEIAANFGGSFSADIGRTGIVIKDNLFKMGLTNTGIFKKRIAGSIGALGTYVSGITTEEIPYTYIDPTDKLVPGTYTSTTHYYRKQISDALYDEVRVVDLRMTYHIWGEYTTIGDETDSILLIPLDRSITTNYSTSDKEVLYSRSLHYVFNSRVVTEVKWYQSSFFQFIVLAVSIYITAVSLGTAGSAAMAAIAAGTLTVQALVLSIAIGVLKMILVSAAIKLFVKEIGVEAAFIVAIAAALIGGYQAYQAGSVAGAPMAQDLLALSTNLSAGIEQTLADAMAGLKSEAIEFGLFVEEQNKLLDKAQDLLEGNKLLSPFVIFGETPNDFFQRTVHSGNIGVMGIDAITSYVDVALRLPKLSETLGD